MKNHHVCKLVKVMGIGNEYWCKNCTSIGNIIDADQDLLLELYCHKGRQEVRKASLLLPLGSCPIVARGKLQSDKDVADPPVDTRPCGIEKQAVMAKKRNLQRIWLYSRSRPSVVARWVERQAQHGSTEGHRPAAARFHLDPECCGRVAGALICRYSCKLNIALGFGLSDWCSRCTDVGNRLGWKIMTRMPIARAQLCHRSLYGEVYLHKWAMNTFAPGHGEQVAKTGHALRPARDECALCQRPEIFDSCHICARHCCFKCLANAKMWSDPLTHYFVSPATELLARALSGECNLRQVSLGHC